MNTKVILVLNKKGKSGYSFGGYGKSYKTAMVDNKSDNIDK
jgi:hypothetical protein